MKSNLWMWCVTRRKIRQKSYLSVRCLVYLETRFSVSVNSRMWACGTTLTQSPIFQDLSDGYNRSLYWCLVSICTTARSQMGRVFVETIEHDDDLPEAWWYCEPDYIWFIFLQSPPSADCYWAGSKWLTSDSGEEGSILGDVLSCGDWRSCVCWTITFLYGLAWYWDRLWLLVVWQDSSKLLVRLSTRWTRLGLGINLVHLRPRRRQVRQWHNAQLAPRHSSFLSPSSYTTFVPSLLSLSPWVIDFRRFPVPSDPFNNFPLGSSAAVALKKTFLKSTAHHFLLLYSLTKPLIEGRGRKWCQSAIHIGLLLLPLPL